MTGLRGVCETWKFLPGEYEPQKLIVASFWLRVLVKML